MPTSFIPMIHLVRVYEKLIATYGEPKNEPDNDPLGGLIATILSQHTSDTNSERAYQQLVTAFPTWESVRDAATCPFAQPSPDAPPRRGEAVLFGKRLQRRLRPSCR